MKPLAPEAARGAATVAACGEVLRAAMAYDLPGDPPPAARDVAALLEPRWPGDRAAFWTAEVHTEVVGLARLYLSTRENPHLGELFVHVHPGYRRRGTGTRLLGEAVSALLSDGRRGVLTEVPEGTDGARFAHARGLRTGQREARSLLDLDSVDRRYLDSLAEEEHPSYRLVAWVDSAPDDLLPSYGLAKRVVRDTPTGLTDLEPPDWDAALVREYEHAVRQRGQQFRVVTAVHEPTGQVVGLTEVCISRWTPRRAVSYDTIVVPAHRGRGLALWMKAEMLRWLRAERAEVTEIVTWTTEENAQLRQIDEVLGYKVDRWWQRCHADVPTLARRLEH